MSSPCSPFLLSFLSFFLVKQRRSSVQSVCYLRRELRLAGYIGQIDAERWREGERERPKRTIFILLMLQYANTSERSRDIIQRLLLDCAGRDFWCSQEISCKSTASLEAQNIPQKILLKRMIRHGLSLHRSTWWPYDPQPLHRVIDQWWLSNYSARCLSFWP